MHSQCLLLVVPRSNGWEDGRDDWDGAAVEDTPIDLGDALPEGQATATQAPPSGNWTAEPLARLSSREAQILEKILDGRSNKNIAADLNISQRTVENHRASIMKKTGSKSVPELVRQAIGARGVLERSRSPAAGAGGGEDRSPADAGPSQPAPSGERPGSRALN